jgi:hypothetical protein
MPPLAGFHLHLYQPPREDPWLGVVTNEWSAWPYHDWNERIATECYRALIAVAVTNGDETATELVEPLTMSSTDIGPTLHRWLEQCSPDVDQALSYQVDHANSGPQSLMIAAPLVHAIIPLTNADDRERLVAWGIADYRRRFGAAPLGMWLPETAVDLASLDCLARQGIQYTVLMPTQVLRVREPGAEWRTVDANSLDTSKAYFVRLTQGRTITVVFGHGSLSQRVAFGDLIDDGIALADEMAGELEGDDGAVLLVADGETYGHHHHFGDLGLAWALRRLRHHYGFETTLGVWLARREPTYEVELAEVSSWSCAHGVERWRSDCGCVTGEQPGWRQTWREPLRESLDWLRATLGGTVDQALAEYLHSPGEALLQYGTVLSGEVDPHDFVAARAVRDLDAAEVALVLEFFEVHRNLLYSFTSCAWFFADPAEIETSIVLRYAAVALGIVRRTLGKDYEPEFLEHLGGVHSNRPGIGGSVLWALACDPFRFDEERIAAGFAAERLACVGHARIERGYWRARAEMVESDPAELRVTLINTLTFREREFRTSSQRTGHLGIRVRVDDGTAIREVSLGELGADVIARVGASWLAGTGSADYEEALNLLVARVLANPAGEDEVAVLVALAGAPRYVTPIGEASIRRAIVAIAGQNPAPDLSIVAPLAKALGMSSVVTREATSVPPIRFS